MRKLDLAGARVSEVRGKRRKMRHLFNWPKELTGFIPVEDFPGRGLWHSHLPAHQAIVDHPLAKPYFRRRCAQALIDAAETLQANCDAATLPARAAALITLPELWDSTLDLFFDEDALRAVVDAMQPLPDRSLVREWSLRLPRGFHERGFEFPFNDGLDLPRYELWAVVRQDGTGWATTSAGWDAPTGRL